jgi:hypothetical protein
MKYLAVLLALPATIAQSETILMMCERPSGLQTYRYTEQFFGFGKTKYEVRKEGQWVPICAPSETSFDYDPTTKGYNAIRCVPGDKAITKKVVSRLGDLPWATHVTETVDFVTLSHKYVNRHSPESTQCKRLNRG